MTSPLFIGVDLGTSGCRAMAIDTQGHIHGEAAVILPTPQRHGDRVEQEPKQWWDAVCNCLTLLVNRLGDAAGEVTAIAVDGTSASLLLTNAKGEALGPALMYNDTRAQQQAGVIRAAAPDNTAAQGPGCALAKLLWLQAQGATQAAHHVLHQADWIAHRLGVRPGISDDNNALKLGFDPRTRIWPRWLDTLDVPRTLLPKVVTPGTPVGQLRPALAKSLGLPTGTHIVAGTTDSTASFMATGAAMPGEAVTALGSTLVLKVISEAPVFAPEFGVYSQPLPLSDYWLVGGASNSGGAVLRQYFTPEQLAAMTPHLRPATPTGLDYYPLPAPGERFPTNDPTLPPRIEPRPANDRVFFQALLEGIAAIEARGYDLLTELGAPSPVSIRTTGGGAGNPAWTTIRARRLDYPLLPAQNAHAAFGSARLAQAALTHL